MLQDLRSGRERATIDASVIQSHRADPNVARQVVADILTALLTIPMQSALYCEASSVQKKTAWRHWALNIPYYTHFTSPIRRYADVCVHRLLTESITGEVWDLGDEDLMQSAGDQNGESDAPKTVMASIAANCNFKKESSKKAQEASDLLFFNCLIRDRFKSGNPIVCDAIVQDMGSVSFTLLLQDYGVDKLVHAVHEWKAEKVDVVYFEDAEAKEGKDGDDRRKTPKQLTVKWGDEEVVLQLCTRVRVKLVPKPGSHPLNFDALPARRAKGSKK